jgi:hypothetical protein
MPIVVERQTGLDIREEREHHFRAPRGKREGIFSLLVYLYVALPIVAGFDKFTGFMVDWEALLAPMLAYWVPAAPFLKIAGAVEIGLGLLVAWKPKLGGILVGCWFLGTAANLFLAGAWLIGIRDILLALGAFALSRWSPHEGAGPSGP